MRNATRHAIALVVFGVLGCGVAAVFTPRHPQAETSTDAVTQAYQGFQAGKCKSCHPAIWREWENSMHAKAWTDEIYQQAAAQVQDRTTTCDPCHAPQPILITGIGEMPKLRDRDRDAGVSCLVCHMDAQGTMHGPPATAETYFHANITNPIYTAPTTLCSTCHGQPTVPEHDQVSSFLDSLNSKDSKDSKGTDENKSCATCHMPTVNRLQSTASYEISKGRKHTWHGSRSLAQLRRAATLHLQIVSGKVNVTLQSKTGHILPGGTLRTLVLQALLLTPNAQPKKEIILIGANTENRLLPNENRTYVLDTLTPTTGDTLKVQLMYQLTPETPEAAWMLMAEKTHAIP